MKIRNILMGCMLATFSVEAHGKGKSSCVESSRARDGRHGSPDYLEDGENGKKGKNGGWRSWRKWPAKIKYMQIVMILFRTPFSIIMIFSAFPLVTPLSRLEVCVWDRPWIPHVTHG